MKLISFVSDNAPTSNKQLNLFIDKRSLIPGSPKNEDEREYHKRIEESKNSEWNWLVTDKEAILI